MNMTGRKGILMKFSDIRREDGYGSIFKGPVKILRNRGEEPGRIDTGGIFGRI